MAVPSCLERARSPLWRGMTAINIADLVSWPLPMEVNALFIAGVVEFFGGLLILIGLWTHLLALLATFIMLMAHLTAHIAWFPTLNNGELAADVFRDLFADLRFRPRPL